MQPGRCPELPPTEDAAATIAALRLPRAKMATLPGMPPTSTIPVVDGDPIPPGLRGDAAELAAAPAGPVRRAGTVDEVPRLLGVA